MTAFDPQRLQKAIDRVQALRIEYGLIWDDYCAARDVPNMQSRYPALLHFKQKLTAKEAELVDALVELQVAGYENPRGLLEHAATANDR